MTYTAEQDMDSSKPRYSYRHELWHLFLDTLPIMLSFLFQNLMQAVSIIIVGRLGTFELSVASFGYMFFSATAQMVAIGGSTAIDTLCSQAYGSASTAKGDQRHYLGIVLQRGLIFLTAFFLVAIVPLWWYSGPLFQLLGQEQRFSNVTQEFLCSLLPAGLMQVWAECVKKFLQVQGHRAAVMYCIGAAALVGVVLNVVLVLHSSLGVLGAVIAYTAYHFITILALVAYMSWSAESRRHWGGFTWKAFQDPLPFIVLLLSGTLTCATEFWCFESVALMAATLDSASIGAQSIIMTSDIVLATVPLSLGISTSHRIGKSLGAGLADLARFQTRIPYLLAICVGSVECVVLLSSRHVYGYIFSQDKDVVDVTAHVLIIMAVFQCFDISNGGAAGILRGSGKTHLAGGSNVVGYYGIGLPLAYVLCFKQRLGIFGLWAGLVIGMASLLVIQSIWVFTVNWQKETDRVLAEAREREGESASETTPLLY